MDKKGYKDSLTAILLGYSVCHFEGRKLFIKHFGNTDSLETDYHYNQAFERAKSKGVYTEEKKLRYLIDNDLWNIKQDEEINSLKLLIPNIKKSKARLTIPSQAREKQKEIDLKEKELTSLLNLKTKLLGVTAEVLANQYVEDYYIYNSFFEDKNLKNLFIQDTFDDVDSDLIFKLRLVYFDSLKYIMSGEIRKIALLPEFQNLMNLSENPYEILGKSYASYSYFQLELLTRGRVYKNILNTEIPFSDTERNDPDKLEERWENSQRVKKAYGETKNKRSESGGGVSMVMGASKDDMQEIAATHEVINIDSKIKEMGGADMNQLIELFGVK